MNEVCMRNPLGGASLRVHSVVPEIEVDLHSLFLLEVEEKFMGLSGLTISDTAFNVSSDSPFLVLAYTESVESSMEFT